MNKEIKNIVRYIIYIFFITAIFFVFVNIIKEQRYDFDYHVYKMFSDNPAIDFYHQNNMFNYFMVLFHNVFNVNLEISASIILTGFIAFRMMILNCIYSKLSSNKLLVTILVCASCLVMSLPNPISKQIYLGQEVGNVWHNAPFILMMPFAIICVYCFIQYFVKLKHENKYLIAMSVSLLLSFFAKPSFTISFVPTCGLYILFDSIKLRSGKQFINNTIRGLLVCVPVIIYLLFFYINTFGNVQDKTFTSICISPFGVWAYYLNMLGNEIDVKILRMIVKALQFILSILLANTFSVFYIIKNKTWRKRECQYFMLMFIVGLLMYCFLAQTGNTYYDGNFSWNYGVGGLILMLYCVGDLLITRQNKSVTIELFILLLQVISGIYYIYLMWNDIIII